MTIWRMTVAGFAVWRLSRLLFKDKGRDRPEDFFSNRILDCIYGLSVWVSAQTAMWVAGGLAGVLLNWVVLSTLSRLLMPSNTPDDGPLSLENPVQLRTEAPKGDFSCLTVEHGMQANHG